jgi:ParB/RepB/Spo0J family partition protein
MTTTTAPVYQLLPLDKLHESPWNPRKTFEPAALSELADSVAKVGVLSPLLVRPNAKGYEIGAGHRRYRAAKLAKLDAVPAIVRPMDDTAFLELLVLENDQRVDVHPLEEAAGYQALMTKAGYSVDRIAERVGRSVKYVYDRVKLLALTPAAKALFLEGRIAAGHAILLARLKPADQKRALEDGVFTHEDLLFNPHDDAKTDTARFEAEKPVSVRELSGWIDQHVRFDRATPDPLLFPETVGTLQAAQEVREKIVPITHEYHVDPEAKVEGERTYGPLSWKRADGRQKSKSCDHAITGVIVVGPGRGEALKVCIAKETCATHWKAEQQARQKRATARPSGPDRVARDRARQEAEQAREAAARDRWVKARPTILEAVAAKVKTAALGKLAPLLLARLEPERWDMERARSAGTPADYVPRGTSADDLVRYAAFLVLWGEACGYRAPQEFPKQVKAFGVDVRKILDQVVPAKAEPKGA